MAGENVFHTIRTIRSGGEGQAVTAEQSSGGCGQDPECCWVSALTLACHGAGRAQLSSSASPPLTSEDVLYVLSCSVMLALGG